MALSTQEANFIGLFVETLLFGILLVAGGYCLRLLLFDPDRLVLKKARDIKRWAVTVVVFMTVASALDLALNLRLNMEAFLWTSYGDAAANLLNDNASWLNVTRFMLYISEVLVADGILIFRLFVVYGRVWSPSVIILCLFLPAGIVTAITVVVLGAAKGNFGDATSDFINAGLLGVDILFNGYTTSLIVYKLWKTRAATLDISIGPDKWLILIRIIIESGMLYMASVVTTLISEPLGNIGITLGDAVGQVIAIASVLIIIRTHDMLRQITPTYGLSGISFPRAAEAALAVSLPMARVISEPSPVVSPRKARALDSDTNEKYTIGAVASGTQASVTQLPYDGLVSSDSNLDDTAP